MINIISHSSFHSNIITIFLINLILLLNICSIISLISDVIKSNFRSYIIFQWADLCKAFLQEAQWFYKKATPNFDEYIENGWISVSGAVQLIHAYFLVTENISKEAIECLDYHHDFLHWPCIIFRLTNDLSSSTVRVLMHQFPLYRWLKNLSLMQRQIMKVNLFLDDQF